MKRITQNSELPGDWTIKDLTPDPFGKAIQQATDAKGADAYFMVDSLSKARKDFAENTEDTTFPDLRLVRQSISDMNILEEEDVFAGMLGNGGNGCEQQDPNSGTWRADAPLFVKTIRVDAPLVMPRCIQLPYTGVVKVMAVLAYGQDGEKLDSQIQTNEFLAIPSDRIQGTSLSVSQDGVLDFGLGKRPPLQSGMYQEDVDETLEYVEPRHLLGGSLWVDGWKQCTRPLVMCFKQRLSRQCRYLTVDILTWVRRDLNHRLLSEKPPHATFMMAHRNNMSASGDSVDTLAPPLGVHRDKNVVVWEEWWRLHVPVYPIVVLPVDAHGFEMRVDAPYLSIDGMLLPLLYNTDGCFNVPTDEYDGGVYFNSNIASLVKVDSTGKELLSHPSLIPYTDPEDCNVALGLNRMAEQNDDPYYFTLFGVHYLDDEGKTDLPKNVWLTMRQYWTGSCPRYSALKDE